MDRIRAHNAFKLAFHGATLVRLPILIAVRVRVDYGAIEDEDLV